MSRKSGYPCPHCGRIAYLPRFPNLCPYCKQGYASSKPSFYDEPCPEYDPDFLKAQQTPEPQEEKKEPVPTPNPVSVKAEGDNEKYCPHCQLVFPMEQRRCSKCNRMLSVRKKQEAKKEPAPEQPSPQVAPQPASQATPMRLRCAFQGGEIILEADASPKVLGRVSHGVFPTTVSSKHLLYFVKDGKLVIQDNGSTNGTYIDGLRLATGVPHVVAELSKGFFTLGLGHKFTLRVSICG